MNTRKVQDFVVKGKEVFVGLEDSKTTWKIAVRCDRMLIHQVAMEATYPVLKRYLDKKFPACTIHLMYEAGFKGFNLYDRLTEDGIDCTVIPPHLVTEPKVNKVKTDKRDARRLALVLEHHDFRDPCCVPDHERREDRQINRTLIARSRRILSAPATGSGSSSTFTASRSPLPKAGGAGRNSWPLRNCPCVSRSK